MILTSDFVPISNRLGVHLREAERLVRLANRFEAVVELERRAGPRVNAKSILGVLLLGGVQGSFVRVLAQGPDAQAALDAMLTALQEGFED